MSDFTPIEKELAPSLPDTFFQEIEEPVNKGHDSFYVFALHKVGSTMLKRMFSAVGAFNGMSNVGIDQFAFRSNLKWTDQQLLDLAKVFLPKGYWYGVFRHLGLERADEFNGFDLSKKSILMVRDPRDVAVSHYYSMKYSHAAPGRVGKKLAEVADTGSDDIDEYTVNFLRRYIQRYRKYIDVLVPSDRCRVFRYEDVVFEKRRFLNDALAFLDLELPDKELAQLVMREDRFPESEDVNRHVRQVAPGDHRAKLQAKTIAELNEMTRDVLEFFDYPIG